MIMSVLLLGINMQMILYMREREREREREWGGVECGDVSCQNKKVFHSCSSYQLIVCVMACLRLCFIESQQG